MDLQEANDIMEHLVNKVKTFYPPTNRVFLAFKLCSLDSLKCVIIGQSPYCQEGMATGLAFANSRDTPEENLSPSLRVLRKSVMDFSLPYGTATFDPSLETWERQGALLLNSALTCPPSQPTSHLPLWETFMHSLLTNLQRRKPNLVYLLMGDEADALSQCITSPYILKTNLPSWFVDNHAKMSHGIWECINGMLLRHCGHNIKWCEVK